LIAFVGQPIVEAATQLYQRLFGQVVADIEAEQALPEDEKLGTLTAGAERRARSHTVEGAFAQIGGVTASVAAMRTAPADEEGEGGQGELDLWLVFSDIPSFDPSRVDFSVVIEGKEIPMKIDERLREYRDGGGRTLTAEDWANEFSGSNSELQDGVPTTWLTFDMEEWRWDEPRQLELKAVIDGQPLSIPFAFDPEKAHAEAVASAEESMPLLEEAYRLEKDELESAKANAVPVGLKGRDYGYDWAISEMSCADDKLYFTAAFGVAEGENPESAGTYFWTNDVTVDGMMVGLGSADRDKSENGGYTAVYQYPLGRDPRNLPKESIVSFALALGDPEKRKDVAFKYEWAAKKATLPRDAAEMQAWVDQARAMNEKLYGQFPEDVGYDLTPLKLTRKKDGVSMTITGVSFCSNVNRLVFHVKFDGDLESSPYTWDWAAAPDVTINGHRCYNDGGSHEGDVLIEYFVSPPMNISEFGNGENVVFDLRLYDRNADNEGTNYPEPADTLRYEFSIDRATLAPLKTEN